LWLRHLLLLFFISYSNARVQSAYKIIFGLKAWQKAMLFLYEQKQVLLFAHDFFKCYYFSYALKKETI